MKNLGIRVGVVGNHLFSFNEAYANQMKFFSELSNADIFTLNTLDRKLFEKRGKYTIINTKYIDINTKGLSKINKLILYIALKYFELTHDIIFLSAGPESKFLDYINKKKCIPIITTYQDPIKFQEFGEKFSKKIPGIIVQSQKIKKKLIKIGVDSRKIHFCFPFIDLNKFPVSPPPPIDIFRLLFASAPNVEEREKNNFHIKGVDILLEAYNRSEELTDLQLCILWRNNYNKFLEDKIQELNLVNKIQVINRTVNDMAPLYAKSHATIIPYTSNWRSPEMPLSALESLISGRPVITTDVVELSDFVKKYGVGVVASPDTDGLTQAIIKLRNNYYKYQKKCVSIIRKLVFSDENTVLDLFSRLGILTRN